MRRAREYHIGEPREITREDMPLIFGPSLRPLTLNVADLHNRHHRVARLAAAGLSRAEICERTGYTPHRVSQLTNAPAMKELILSYRDQITRQFVESTDEYASTAVENLLRAEDLIADRLDRAENGEPISLKDLVALTADRADRFGYPKKSVQGVAKIDFAAALEAANRRSQNARRTEDA